MSSRATFVLVSAAVAAVGALGLGLGLLLYPDSNLLGGFALVFGPVYWLGFVLLAVSIVVWLVDAVRRRLRGRRGSPAETESSRP